MPAYSTWSFLGIVGRHGQVAPNSPCQGLRLPGRWLEVIDEDAARFRQENGGPLHSKTLEWCVVPAGYFLEGNTRDGSRFKASIIPVDTAHLAQVNHGRSETAQP